MNQPLDGRTVLVTGANGGLGQEFVAQALALGARRVYAAARSPREWGDARILPLALDVTSGDAIAAAAETAGDVDLLVNNAGLAPTDDSIAQGADDQLRAIIETNLVGPLRLARAFAPTLAANGGGTLLNVLSSAAWVPMPTVYAASKAGMWGATNALRMALGAQGTQVVGLLVGMIDTPMAASWDVPKSSPDDVVAQAYAGVAAGATEVLADDQTRMVKGELSRPGDELYPWFAEQLAAFLG